MVQDRERLGKAGKLDLHRLKEVTVLLIAGPGPLGAEWRGCSECHVGGDVLLVYRIGEDGTVIFVTTGSHSDLFG